MKKLDKFVLKSFIGPLILTFFIVLIILLLQFLWMYVDELAGKGLNFKIMAELLFQFSLSFVPTALPLAILLAALMTFGNMGEFSELTALKSSGIPLMRIMRPLMIMIIILVGVSFLFSNYVLPYSNQQARSLLYSIRRKRPDINLQAGTFNNDIDGFSIKVAAKDPFTNRLDGLIIYDQRGRNGNTSITTADSGYMHVTPDETAMIMTLYNGKSFTEVEEKSSVPEERSYPSRRDFFNKQTIVVPLTGFDLEKTSTELFKSASWRMNMAELSYYFDSLYKEFRTREYFQFRNFAQVKIYTAKNDFTGYSTQQPVIKPLTDSIRFDVNKLFDSLKVEEKRTALEKSIADLKDAMEFVSTNHETMKDHIRNMNDFRVNWHKKLTLPFACLVFFFIGAPLGAIIRKGGLGTPSVISILFFVVWYVISISGEKVVEEGLVGSIPGMWASSFILLPVGLFLTYKASNDSMIMNIETYLTFFRKIRDYLYKITIQGKTKNPDNKPPEDEQL